MKIGDLFVKIGANTKNFSQGINEAKKKTSLFGSAIKKVGGIIAGAFAVRSIINFAKKAVSAFDIQAKAEQQLLTALKGRRDAQQQLIIQAQTLQKTTLFGDEETIKAQALIAAFVKESDQIKTIIPLVQDLAAAKNMDLAGASDLVSKTLGSSTNALSRYGIQVEGAVGSVERLTSLQKGLNDAFGGQAQAAAKAGVGALKQLSNAWGDFMELAGQGGSGALNENARFLLAIVEAMNRGMTNAIQKNKTEQQKALEEIKNSTDNQLINFKQGWEKSIDLYQKMWKKAVDSNDSESRAFYSMQIDLSHEMLENIQREIDSRKKETKATEKQVTLLQAAQIAARDAQKALDDFMNKGGKFAGEESAQAYIDKLKELKQAVKDAQKQLEEMQPAQRIAAPDQISGIGSAIVTGSNKNGGSENGLADMSKIFGRNAEMIREAQQKMIEDAKRFSDEFSSVMSQGASEAIQTFAKNIGEGLATGNWDDFGKDILDTVGKFMQQLGALFVSFGTYLLMAQVGASTFNPFLMIAAGAGLIAAGAAISALSSKGMKGGSSSYAMSSGGGGGFHANSAVAALSGNVVFELEGTKLKGAIDNTNRRNNLIR